MLEFNVFTRLNNLNQWLDFKVLTWLGSELKQYGDLLFTSLGRVYTEV